MTLLVSLQPLVDSSNPLHRPVIQFAQMTSVIKVEISLKEHKRAIIPIPWQKGFFQYSQRFAGIALKVPCFMLQVLILACK